MNYKFGAVLSFLMIINNSYWFITSKNIQVISLSAALLVCMIIMFIYSIIKLVDESKIR